METDISITLDFSGNIFKGMYKGKILFREKTKEDYENRIEDINKFISEKGLLKEKFTNLPFKIKETEKLKALLFTILQGEDKKEFEIKAEYLTSPLSKAKFVSSYYKLKKESIEEMIESLPVKEKMRYNLLCILYNKSNLIAFSKDGFCKELIEAYSSTNNQFLDSKVKMTNLEDLSAINYLIESDNDVVLSLMNLLENYKYNNNYFKKYNLELDILNIFSNILVEQSLISCNDKSFRKDDLTSLNLKELNSKPSNLIISKYLSDRNLI